MLNIKGITREQIQLQVNALNKLYVQYRDNDRHGCPLCDADRKTITKITCGGCPWIWFIGHMCLAGVRKWKRKSNLQVYSAYCLDGTNSIWTKYRMRQIKRWIKKLEEVLDGNK